MIIMSSVMDKTIERGPALLTYSRAHDGDHGEGWSELWKANFKPWDKGFPCPELEDAFEKDKVESGKLPSGERKTALVPVRRSPPPTSQAISNRFNVGLWSRLRLRYARQQRLRCRRSRNRTPRHRSRTEILCRAPRKGRIRQSSER